MKKSAISRRTVCKAGIVSGLAMPLSALGQPADRMRPQPGDLLVFDGGDLDGQNITVDQLLMNAQPLAAVPKDPASGVIRSRSRLNRVMVMNMDATQMSDRTTANAVDGIIAYSAVCTHTGCDVTNWNEGELNMACPCHESQFDVLNNGTVVGGPAPRPLAMLPLQLQSNKVVVAGAFKGRVGFQQQF
jgi:rieske iron-sulfur protein